MNVIARDVMETDFETVRSNALVSEAARVIFTGKTRATGYKPFGVMVIDDVERLVGMLSMFDILYRLRPPFMNYEQQSLEIWDGELEPYLDQFSGMRVEQIMSTPVATVSPEDHLMLVIDRMIKKKARRMPVVEGEKILGLVYLSDVFHHLCSSWIDS